MRNRTPVSGWRRSALAAVAMVAAFAIGVGPASASRAPIVIAYEKTCDDVAGHCIGTAGDTGSIEMQVTGIRVSDRGVRLSFVEWITVGDISFTAELQGHVNPAGFIELTGTVTSGSFAGAQIEQRSDLVGVAGTTSTWTGSLTLSRPRS